MENSGILKVEDIMQRNIKTVKFIDSVQTAAEIMDKEEISFLLVDDENGNILGAITRKDISGRICRRPKKKQDEILVVSVMSAPIVTVNENLSVREAAKFLHKKNFKRCPVDDGEKIVGVVGISDILKCVADGKI